MRCYCSPYRPVIMSLRHRVTWRPLPVGTEMLLLSGCDLMTVIRGVMMMREREDVPTWLMIYALCVCRHGDPVSVA